MCIPCFILRLVLLADLGVSVTESQGENVLINCECGNLKVCIACLHSSL